MADLHAPIAGWSVPEQAAYLRGYGAAAQDSTERFRSVILPRLREAGLGEPALMAVVEAFYDSAEGMVADIGTAVNKVPGSQR